MNLPRYYRGPEDFWARITKDATGCWLYPVSYRVSGHAQICYMGRRVLAHRLAWEFTHGVPPADKFLCHKCDVPLCVNPDHLFLGTHADNMADMAQKLRVPHAKLNPESVRKIRTMFATHKLAAIGREFSVSHATLIDIRKGVTWKHVQ